MAADGKTPREMFEAAGNRASSDLGVLNQKIETLLDTAAEPRPAALQELLDRFPAAPQHVRDLGRVVPGVLTQVLEPQPACPSAVSTVLGDDPRLVARR